MAVAREKRKKIKLKGSLFAIASNFLSRGFGFIFTPIFTRLLSPDEYGIYSLYVGLMGLFTVFVTFEIPGNVTYRALARFGKENEERFLSAALGMISLLNIFFVSVFILFRRWINGMTSLGTPLTLCLFAQIFFNAAIGLYFSKKRYHGRALPVALINLATGLLPPTFSVALIRLGGGGSARIFSSLTVSAAIALPICFDILHRGKRLFSRDEWKFLFRMTLPQLPHYLALSAIAQSDKIVIARGFGDGEVGKYSAAMSLGLAPSILTSALMLALSPWLIRKLGEGGYGSIEKTVTPLVKAVFLLTLAYFSLLPEIFSLLLARSYGEALPTAYPAAMSVAVLFPTSCISSCLLHYEKPHLGAKNTIIAAGVCVFLCILLSSRISYKATSFGSLGAYSLLFLMNRRTLKKLSEGRINVNISWRFALFVLGFALAFYLIRESLAARLILLLALLLSALPEVKNYKRLLVFKRA